MSTVIPVCDRIITYNTSTAVIPGFEGIPQNLLINFIGWLVLLFIFSVLRKSAWDYGRIALTKPRHNKWATLFYSEVRTPLPRDSPLSSTAEHDSGFFSWLRLLFTLTNADLQSRCGLDAVHYLRFQSYLIIYTAITMVVCLTVILPLNISGTLKSPGLQNFGVTTISNLPGDSLLLWIHVSFGVVFFSIAFALMQHFSKRFWNEAALLRLVSFRTLMISGLSKSQRNREQLLRYLTETFPGCSIDDVQVCFDIRRLVSLENKLESVMAALAYSQRYLVRKGRRLMIIARCCGWFFLGCRRRCCCQPHLHSRDPERPPDEPIVRHASDRLAVDCSCCCSCCHSPPVDAIDYYSSEVERLHCQIEQENAVALRHTIGVAFVTFSHRESALRVHKSFRHVCGRPPSLGLPGKTGTCFWNVQFAPTPNNIIWPNLAVTQTAWWFRAITVNLVVLILVFFLTTPTYVLNLLNRIPEIAQIDNPIINQFLPSIILWVVSALLPSLVFNSDWLVRHWTRSVLNLTVMVKTFTLLILMVLVLPSLGLTSISALLQWLFPVMHLIPLVPSENTTTVPDPPVTTESEPWTPINKQTFQWECVFVPDNGAFFVNYVITSALIGTALTLARIPELAIYMFRILLLRSKAERTTARKRTQYEFEFGLQYAWTLCVFAVISAYSILCPLITPFGLLYLGLRYLVDRYNLFFAYLPSRVDSRTHWLAMIFMLASVLLLQLNLFMFIVLRLGPLTNPLSIVALVGLVVSVLLWISSIVTGWILVGSAPMRRPLPSVVSSPRQTMGEASPGTHWEAMTLRAFGTVPNEETQAFDREQQLELAVPDGVGEPQHDVLQSGDDVLRVDVRRTFTMQSSRLPTDQPDDGWLTLSRMNPRYAPSFVRTMVDNSKATQGSISSSDEN